MNIAYVYEDNPLFERKIENATAGLKPILQRILKKNAATIADYIISMQTEINPSDHYTTLVLSSIALTPTTTLQASSKGLKLYLTIDTNLNDDVRINTYQHGDRVFTHDSVIHSGSNEVTLQYPSGLIDTAEFRICVRSNNYDESTCDTGYNS
jgi:hypothetical protein